MSRTITIQLTARSIALLLAALAAIWLVVVFDKILLILFLATLLAIAIDPLVDRLETRRVPRAAAILLTYVLLVSVFAAVVGLLIPVLVAEFGQLSTTLPRVFQNLLALPGTLIAPRFPALARTLQSSNLSQQLGGEVGALVGGLGGLLAGLARTLTTVAISTFLVLVVGFFLAADARFAPRLIARFFPPTARPTAALLAREIGTRLGHWVRAQLLVAIFFGTTFGIGLGLLGVPYALSLGVVGAVLELIPYLGGALVTAIAALLALTVAPWLPLAVLALEVVVANVESHIVYPKLVGDIVGLHPLTIIVALFVGAEAKGIMGALLAVPVAVVIQVLFDHFYRFDTAPAASIPALPESVRPAPRAARPTTYEGH